MAFTHKTQWQSGGLHILSISGSSASSLLSIIMIRNGLTKDKFEEVKVLTPIWKKSPLQMEVQPNKY